MQASMQGGQEEIALLLLQNNFEISDQGDYGKILQAASQAGQVKVVDLLQRTYGLSLGKLSSAKSNSIRAAISKGRIGVLDRRARSAQDQIEELPTDSIAIAAVGGHDKIIVLLLDMGLDIEHEGQFGTPLRAASLLGHESTVQLLLDRGAKANAVCSLENALEAAAMNCHLSIAILLLHKGADANCRGGFYGTALQTAAHRGHSEIVKLLLDAGAEMDSPGFAKDAIIAAALGGHENIVRLFLDRGFKPREPLPRKMGISTGRSKRADILRDSSPSRKSKTTVPRTRYSQDDAHEAAASEGHRQVVELVLSSRYVSQEWGFDISSALYCTKHHSMAMKISLMFSLIPYPKERRGN